MAGRTLPALQPAGSFLDNTGGEIHLFFLFNDRLFIFELSFHYF